MESISNGIRAFSRRENIIRLAKDIRNRYNPREIDLIADECNIVLVRTTGATGREAGFAYIEIRRYPEIVESLSHPDSPVLVWGGWRHQEIYSIVINTNSGIPEAEIFWHEWYHLFHSPRGIQQSDRFEHRYSTDGVLHNQEERRADEFAAALLIPTLEECETIFDVCAHFGVSQRLAEKAITMQREYLNT